MNARADKRTLTSPQMFAAWQSRQHRRQLRLFACRVVATVLLGAAFVIAATVLARWA